MHQTKRLTLRPLTLQDFDALHEILSDEESMAYYPHPFTEEETIQWIKWNLENYEQNGFGLWALIRRDTGAFIGDCGITMQPIQGSLVPEIGFHLHKSQTGNGYATEAALLCVQIGFEEYEFETLYSYSNESNIPSQRVAQRIGMTLQNIVTEPSGKRTVVYALDRSDTSWKRNSQ